MTFHEFLWDSMGFHNNYFNNCIIFQNFPELSIKFHRLPWPSTRFHGVSITLSGPCMVLQGPRRTTDISTILLGTHNAVRTCFWSGNTCFVNWDMYFYDLWMCQVA